MNWRMKCLLFLLVSISATGFSQKTDRLVNKPDSLTGKTGSAVGQVNNIIPKVNIENTKLTFNTYFILLGNDLKKSFTKPFHMKKRDWENLGKFALVAGVLSFFDEPIQKGALSLRNNSPGLDNVSKNITNFGGINEVYTLAAFEAYGFISKNEKLKITTLLATQSYLTAGAVENVVKFLTGRTRPSVYPAGVEAEPQFFGPFSKTAKDAGGKKISSSFPSGHTTVAFAAATVFALEYRNRLIVPIVVYSAATLIGLSRITENKHWSTDVLVGAALGFLTGREVVNNYHRYSKLNASHQKKNTITFNPGYSYGHFTMGIFYKFR